MTSCPRMATVPNGRAARMAAATTDFPDPLLPRNVISRVELEPTASFSTPTLLSCPDEPCGLRPFTARAAYGFANRRCRSARHAHVRRAISGDCGQPMGTWDKSCHVPSPQRVFKVRRTDGARGFWYAKMFRRCRA
jgi:hypothetical protein